MDQQNTAAAPEVVRELSDHERSIISPKIQQLGQVEQMMAMQGVAKAHLEEELAAMTTLLEPRIASGEVRFNRRALRFERVPASASAEPPATPTEEVTGA